MKDDELPTPAGFRDAPMYIDPYFWLICMAHGWQIYHIDMGPSGEIGVPHMAKKREHPNLMAPEITPEHLQPSNLGFLWAEIQGLHSLPTVMGREV